MGKYLQFLKEAMPKVSRVAVLVKGPSFSPEQGWGAIVAAAAQALDVTPEWYVVPMPEDLDDAFGAMAKARTEALLVIPHPAMVVHARRIVDLAAQYRLPAVYPHREMAELGGLLAYDVDHLRNFRRVGHYVDRIFKGAKPGDLPVEQPTKFDLIINLRTAKALGIIIPQSLLLRADRVVE
jgi:putative ABC transport system substrate-binding protein